MWAAKATPMMTGEEAKKKIMSNAGASFRTLFLKKKVDKNRNIYGTQPGTKKDCSWSICGTTPRT